MGWSKQDFTATFQRMLRQRYEEIGREVERLRNNLGYSQEELAFRARVSVKTVSRIESPPKAPKEPHEIRGSTYRKLAEVLGVTVEHLRAPLMRNVAITESEEAPDPAAELLQALEDAAEQDPEEGAGNGPSSS